jgi:hypothetical protein
MYLQTLLNLSWYRLPGLKPVSFFQKKALWKVNVICEFYIRPLGDFSDLDLGYLHPQSNQEDKNLIVDLNLDLHLGLV